MILNGQNVELAQSQTLAEVLAQAGFEPSRVAVLKNGQIVSRTEADTLAISDSDVLEVVAFVGGG
ncbi:MAG: sulfur carrier protein ThiS [Deltaproteobacteria bacterium]|jgi:sulfur carrier protein|nr:sulfur carrier protein ThiS [Deltaproteobacteria bacterium]